MNFNNLIVYEKWEKRVIYILQQSLFLTPSRKKISFARKKDSFTSFSITFFFFANGTDSIALRFCCNKFTSPSWLGRNKGLDFLRLWENQRWDLSKVRMIIFHVKESAFYGITSAPWKQLPRMTEMNIRGSIIKLCTRTSPAKHEFVNRFPLVLRLFQLHYFNKLPLDQA